MSNPVEKKKSKTRKAQKLVQFDKYSSTGREDVVDSPAVEEFNQNPAKPKHKKRKWEEDKDEHEKSPKRAKLEGFAGLVRFRLGSIQNNPNLEIDGNTEPSTSTSTKHVECPSGKSPKKIKKHKSRAPKELESTNVSEIPSTSDDSNRKVKKKHSKKQNTGNELAINAQSEIVETACVGEKEKKNKHKMKKQKELKAVSQSQDDQFDVYHDVQEANPKIVQNEESVNDKNCEVALKKKKKKAKKAKEEDSDVIFLENLFHDDERCTVYEKRKKRKKECADVNDNKELKKGQLQDEGISNLVVDKSGSATTPIKKTKKQRSLENNTSMSASNDAFVIDELIRSTEGSVADSTLTDVSAKAKTKRTKVNYPVQKQKVNDDGEYVANIVECELQQPKQKKRRKVDVASTDISMESNSMHFSGKKSDTVLIQENVAANSKTNIKPSSCTNANLKDNSISEITEIKDGKSKTPKKSKKDNSVVKTIVEHRSLKESSKEQYNSAGLVQDSATYDSSKVQDHKMSATTNSDLQGTGNAASSLSGKKKKKKKRKKSFTESNSNLMVSDVASSCVSAGKKQTSPVPVGDTTTASNIENAQVSSKKQKKKRKKKKRAENTEAAGTSNDKDKLSISDVKPVQSSKKLQVRKKLSLSTNQLNTHLQLSPKSPLVFHKRSQHKKLKDILNRKIEETTQSSEAQRLDETNNDTVKADKSAPRNDRSKHLQEKSWAKLNAARFRYLNEQMYTTTGQEAKKMFAADPDSYKVYQEGYKSQVKKWPINPVDVIIEDLKSKSSSLIIADFGCGDAKIAKSFPDRVVHSFDLVATNKNVIQCDMSKVPLQNSSIHIAVFCLSLMGTNLNDYITEAHRVLKTGGLLKIAEVESRFENVNDFIKKIKLFGFSLAKKDLSHNMFMFVDFKKVSRPKSANLPVLSLSPCVYKKR